MTGEPLTERLPRYPVIRVCRACQVRDAGRYDDESGAVRDLEPGEYLGWRPYDPEEDGG